MAIKLTIPVIEALKPKADGRVAVLRDQAVPGLVVRALPNGRKTFVYSYRRSDGRQNSIKLGVFGEITLVQARELAKEHAYAVAKGRDPARERARLRQAETVAEFAVRYRKEHLEVRTKTSWCREATRLLDRCIIPKLGALKIGTLASEDAYKLHASMSATPGQANRVLAVLSHMLTHAMKTGVRPQGINPCKFVERYPESARDRALSEEELMALGAALRAGEVPPNAALALKLLLFTGGRLGEVLGMRWEWVNLQAGVVKLPDAKTGARPLYLSPLAVALLAAEKVKGAGAFVVPGSTSEASLTVHQMEKIWAKLRKRLGLNDVRLHDFRHTAGTFAGMSGANQFLVRDYLGHKGVAMTAKYVSKHAAPVQQVAEVVSSRIAKLLEGEHPAQVLPLKQEA